MQKGAGKLGEIVLIDFSDPEVLFLERTCAFNKYLFRAWYNV